MRRCRCGAQLGKRNRSGLCAPCYQALPVAEKADQAVRKLRAELEAERAARRRLAAESQREIKERDRRIAALCARLDGLEAQLRPTGDPIPF